jgi:hypothetical protein
MRTLQNGTGAFQKVGECLYRYSNGVYYGRIRVDGKEIKRSLSEFRDEQRQTDRSQGKLTIAELCDRYLQTIQNQKLKTIERKSSSFAESKSTGLPKD